MKSKVRRFLTALTLGTVLVSAVPSLSEAAPAKDRSPAMRSVRVWAPFASLAELWNSLRGWAAQASTEGKKPGDGEGSSGSSPVPPGPPDQGPGIDPDGKNKK
ncbi:MAG TPA: hypothetical protein VHN15_06360 [Thermoanaerobaculia bacterium]|nr:hypothetical protein [Thermoanaerobaculia bacterium]